MMQRTKERKTGIFKWSVLLVLFMVLLFTGSEAQAEAKAYKSSDGKVTVTLKKNTANFDGWAEYFVTVKNNTNKEIKNWSATLTMTQNVSDVKTWDGLGLSVSGSGKKITLKGAKGYKTLPAKTQILPSGAKFGYGGTPIASVKKVKVSHGKVSKSKDRSSGSSGSSGDTGEYVLTGKTKDVAYADTPVGKHGKLKVSGTQLVDEKGNAIILRGASTHGIQWAEMSPYVNKGAFQSLRDEWGVNMVRLAGYVTQGGYTQGAKDSMDATFQKGVKAATDLGMYVIIDWHIHAENPNDTIDDAKKFFKKYASLYKDNDNVIFEICNEPTNTPWYDKSKKDIYTYAKTIVPIIRNYTDAVVVCGTNTWSQDVDQVDPSQLKQDNVMYTIHFYSGTHGQDLRDKVTTALKKGVPVFCTEFGICDASGNGGFNISEANKWIDFFDKNGISYCCWSLCNKDESASYLKPTCTKTEGGWTNSDLAKTGQWLVNTYRSRQDAEEGANTKAKLPEKGKVYVSGGYKYLVTRAAKKNGTVSLVGSKNKKKTSIKVNDTVTLQGYSFKITAIGKKAFAGYKKLKKVTIGKNVKSIGQKAFYNDRKLSKITFQSKKKVKIGKKAFKGTKKKKTIKAPKKLLKKYKKLCK